MFVSLFFQIQDEVFIRPVEFVDGINFLWLAVPHKYCTSSVYQWPIVQSLLLKQILDDILAVVMVLFACYLVANTKLWWFRRPTNYITAIIQIQDPSDIDTLCTKPKMTDSISSPCTMLLNINITYNATLIYYMFLARI